MQIVGIVSYRLKECADVAYPGVVCYYNVQMLPERIEINLLRKVPEQVEQFMHLLRPHGKEGSFKIRNDGFRCCYLQ